VGWWNDPGPKCKRCHESTSGCPECKGEGSVFEIASRMSCSNCAGTGWLCTVNDHGKYWT